MADNNKVLKTRIQNKFATADAWSKSTLTLLPGELAIMPISAATSDKDGFGGNDATTLGYMIKVGNGDTFANSKGLVALAADVHSWAKDAAFNEGTYGTGAVDGNLPKTHAAIKALQDAIGSSGSVSGMIKAAIETLDENTWVAEDGIKFVTAVGETDGKITVTRRALAKADILDAVSSLARTDITEIDNAIKGVETRASDIEATLAGYSKNATVATAIEGLISRLETLETHKTNFEPKVNTLITDLDTAEVKIGNIETDVKTIKSDLNTETTGLKAKVATAEGEIDALQAALTDYTAENAIKTKFNAVGVQIDGLDGRIDNIEAVIGGVTGAMHFVGALEVAPTTGSNGDVYVNTKTNKEYVYSDGAWVELGDVTEEARQISEIKDVLGDYTAAGSVKAAITKEASDRAAADTTLQNNIDTLSTTVTNNASANATAHTGFTTDITNIKATLEGYSKDSKVKAAVDAVSQLATTASTNAADAQDRVGVVENVVKGFSGEKAIETAVNAAKTAADNAQADVDALEKLVGTKNDGATKETVYGAIAAHAATAADTYATKTTVTGIDNRVAAVEGNYIKTSTDNHIVDQTGAFIIFDCGGAE